MKGAVGLDAQWTSSAPRPQQQSGLFSRGLPINDRDLREARPAPNGALRDDATTRCATRRLASPIFGNNAASAARMKRQTRRTPMNRAARLAASLALTARRCR